MNMNYKKYFKKFVRSKKRVTVPKGPSMMKRKKKTTIRARKLKEDLLRKQKEKEKELKVRFKARDVPTEVTMDLYQHMIDVKKEKRRARVANTIKDI